MAEVELKQAEFYAGNYNFFTLNHGQQLHYIRLLLETSCKSIIRSASESFHSYTPHNM